MASLSPSADLFLYDGRILTLDPARPVAEAVAVAGGQILAVGKTNMLRPLVSPQTHVIPCHGHTVLPGFIDPHLHLFAWASRFCGVDVSSARSLAEIQTRLADRLLQAPPSEWLRAYGYDEFFLAEKRHPTRVDLDRVSHGHPIILRHRTGHAAVLNSAALARARITRDFVPPAGGIIEKDPSTHEPTGVVYELEPFLRTVLPPLPPADFLAGLKKAGQELLRQGVTSFHDASAGNNENDVRIFQQLHDTGILRSHTTVMLGIGALSALTASGCSAMLANDERLRIGSIKIMVHEGRGEIYPPPDDLAKMVWEVHRRHLQVALHAVEEGAVWATIHALERAQQQLPRTDHRHRIEHCALCPSPFIEALAKTGIAVVTQPGFLYHYGEKYAAEVAPELHDWLYRSKSFLAQGISVAGSSDCPIAPIAPLEGIQAAMTRRTRAGQVLNPQECLSLTEAIALFTRNAAWVGFDEHKRGIIREGMLADLVVLDSDLMTVPLDAVATLKPALTIIGGEVVWVA